MTPTSCWSVTTATSSTRSPQLCDGSRQVGVIGFTEFINSQFRNLPGLRIFDLEYDLGAFNTPLPRVRIIPIDQFDPLDFL